MSHIGRILNVRPLGLSSEQQPTSHLTLGTLVGEDQSLLCFIFLLLFQLQSKHSFPAEKKNSSVQSWKQIISHAGRKKACRGGLSAPSSTQSGDQKTSSTSRLSSLSRNHCTRLGRAGVSNHASSAPLMSSALPCPFQVL